MSKYISKYSNGKTVTAAQYITEIICENKARIDKKDLHYRFWTNKEWASFYKSQIFTANRLLKKYSAKAIISAIKDKKCYRIYSLRSKFLTPVIKNYERILSKQNKDVTIDLDRTKSTYKQHKNSKNILSKLKDLDDEQDKDQSQK